MNWENPGKLGATYLHLHTHHLHCQQPDAVNLFPLSFIFYSDSFWLCRHCPVCLLLQSSAGPDRQSWGYLPSENPCGFHISFLIETHLLLLLAATQRFLSALCSIVPSSKDFFSFFFALWIPTWLMFEAGDGGDVHPGLLRWLLSILLHFSHNEVSAGLSSDCQQLSAGERSLMSGPRCLPVMVHPSGSCSWLRKPKNSLHGYLKFFRSARCE